MLGGHSARQGGLAALALLHLADGATPPATAAALKTLTSKAVRVIAHRYLKGGLDRALLYQKRRPGASPLLEPSQGNGLSRWSAASTRRPRPLDRPSLPSSEAQIGAAGRPQNDSRSAADHDLKPWREKNVVCGRSG